MSPWLNTWSWDSWPGLLPPLETMSPRCQIWQCSLWDAVILFLPRILPPEKVPGGFTSVQLNDMAQVVKQDHPTCSPPWTHQRHESCSVSRCHHSMTWVAFSSLGRSFLNRSGFLIRPKRNFPRNKWGLVKWSIEDSCPGFIFLDLVCFCIHFLNLIHVFESIPFCLITQSMFLSSDQRTVYEQVVCNSVFH